MHSSLMWRRSLTLSLFTLLGQAQAAVWHAQVCSDLEIRGEERIAFSQTETRLLCGDPAVPGWKHVPRNQALFSLRTFLEDRGYYFPKIRTEGNRTVVDLGRPTLVSSLVFKGAPADIPWNPAEFRSERLTPSLLQSISNAQSSRLGENGYPCATVDTQANPATGEVVVRIEGAKKAILVGVEEERVPGIAPGTLRRYDAFELGKPFQSDLLQLTANRTIADGVLQNTFFNAICAAQGAIAEQKVLPGQPRLITVGFGLNTDRGLSARTSWKHSRLGKHASQLQVTVSASFKGYEFNTQEGRVDSVWYPLQRPSRFHFRSSLDFLHLSDNRKDVLKGTLQFAPAITWDNQAIGSFLTLGPELNLERKIRGVGRNEVNFLSLGSHLQFTSHDFEAQRTEPRSGFESTTGMSISQLGWLADFSSRLIRTRYTHLWPIPAQTHRFFVLGTRTGLATTFVREEEGGLGTLIPSLRQYLGGTGNLRGFAFQELPDEQGGLFSFFTSLEIRGVGWLPLSIQPYLFTDVGTVAKSVFDFSAPWFLSPGAGIRLPTPVGNFRLSLSHGYALAQTTPNPALSHWQMHFNYGEEF